MSRTHMMPPRLAPPIHRHDIGYLHRYPSAHHHQPYVVSNSQQPHFPPLFIYNSKPHSLVPNFPLTSAHPWFLPSASHTPHQPGNHDTIASTPSALLTTLPRLPPPPPPPGQPPIRKITFLVMEGILKKYQQKFKKVREEMNHWEDLQSRLISQFNNASSIIGRIEVIGDKKNYGGLKGVDGIEDAVLQKQMESLETILLSIKKTMEDFQSIVLSLEKMVRDSRQLAGRGSHQLSTKQLQQRVGVKPSLSDCLDGLAILQEMHRSEYLLKSSVVSALLNIALKPSSKDLGALRQLLFDQPNIPRDEVQFIYNIIFAEDIC